MRDRTEREEEISRMDLSCLLSALREGRVRASEATAAFAAAAATADARTNCVTEFLASAEEEATRLDAIPAGERGRLHGLPVSLKVGRR